MRWRALPLDHAVRNLFRRPLRSAVTLAALTVVVLLVLMVLGFVRGLERSLAVSGDPDVVLVYSLGAESDIENSSVEARAPDLLNASLTGIQRRFGVAHVSPELYLATRIGRAPEAQGSLGLLRGVTSTAPLVRRSVRVEEGSWPGPGEVLVGRLAETKLGYAPGTLSIGDDLYFEGRAWRVAGRFAAQGAAYEAEIWCPLPDLQRALKRQDLSVVALLLAPTGRAKEVTLFCKQRNDLELQAVTETNYYASLQRFYRPVRMLAWCVAGLIGGAGVFAGFNTMYGAVVGRVRELATLQVLGFRRRAILWSLIQESTLLSAAASLLAGVAALTLVHGTAVRFTMGAFRLEIDGTALLLGCAVGLVLGILGALPAGIRALRMPVAASLKAV